jgi:hypothetical protein
VDVETHPVKVPDCVHAWKTWIRGGEPLDVRVCVLCGRPDWADLRRQWAERMVHAQDTGRREALGDIRSLMHATIVLEDTAAIARRFGADSATVAGVARRGAVRYLQEQQTAASHRADTPAGPGMRWAQTIVGSRPVQVKVQAKSVGVRVGRLNLSWWWSRPFSCIPQVELCTLTRYSCGLGLQVWRSHWAVQWWPAGTPYDRAGTIREPIDRR